MEEIINAIKEMAYTEPYTAEEINYNNALYDVIEMLKKRRTNDR